jgi:hypothetical protein
MDESVILTNFLDVNFEEGYRDGPINGQQGGLSGGAWLAGSGVFEIQEDYAQGKGRALRSSRKDAGTAEVPLIKRLDTLTPRIYFAVDVYRRGNHDQGIWTLINKASGATTGLGFMIGGGAGPLLRYLTETNRKGTDSTFTVDNGVWHRFEIEAEGISKRYNFYVQVEGKPGRTLIAKDVPWVAHNRYVNTFQIYPYGQMESIMITDNIVVWAVSEFPIHRPFHSGTHP